MEEEISLRELIDIILKNKKIIIVVTLAATLVAAVLSFFVIKPTYEATTTLSVTDVTPTTGFFGSNTTVILPGKDSNLPTVQSYSIEKDLSSLLSSLLKYPDMSVETFKEEVTNPIVLMNTIKQLGLDPQKYTVENLKKQISVSVVNNTNLITVTVKENNPELVAKIADTIAQNFRTYIIERNNRQTDKLIETLNKLITLQNDKIKEATTELNKVQTNSQDKLLIEQKQKQLDLLKNTRDIMLEKYNMLELVKESELGNQSILITSKALIPDKPVAPKKSLNIIIAFILGLMISIFIVFFMEYWKSTEPKRAVESK
ncbi:YveK family protein [Thermoanaerobacter indiensis]|uniref:YveK family protein n=1 Tax=Thermoanaerobacter indiensis TaxID=1125974 RepID=UPI00037408FE|nr:Wzz/FepE/Etk N-terminal domain-containing protein [Thermoanaerobacter indiensis]